MSDLCYNCGDCHFPKACSVALKYCDICQNYGHAFNFCPLSVRKKDPLYQFWALCHNCDVWHLPDPCKRPLHQCMQCSQNGHMEFFCPVQPITRKATEELYATPVNVTSGTKRQRKDASTADVKTGAADANLPSLEMVRHIKAEAASETCHLLDLGFAKAHILQFMSGVDPMQALNGHFLPPAPGHAGAGAASVNYAPVTLAATPAPIHSSGTNGVAHRNTVQNPGADHQALHMSNNSLMYPSETPAPHQKSSSTPATQAQGFAIHNGAQIKSDATHTGHDWSLNQTTGLAMPGHEAESHTTDNLGAAFAPTPDTDKGGLSHLRDASTATETFRPDQAGSETQQPADLHPPQASYQQDVGAAGDFQLAPWFDQKDAAPAMQAIAQQAQVAADPSVAGDVAQPAQAPALVDKAAEKAKKATRARSKRSMLPSITPHAGG